MAKVTATREGAREIGGASRDLAGRRARARGRHQRRADPGRCAPASAAPTCTSTTGTPGRRRPSPCRWSSATSSSGEIVEVGSNVNDFRPGEIVSGEGHVVCGRCRNCLAGRRHLCADTQGVGVNRPGAFAEYIALPMTQRLAARRTASTCDVAAIFDPFGNAVHTALVVPGARRGRADHRRRADRHHGRRGRPPRRARGTSSITDVNPYRLELARQDGRHAAPSTSASETLADVQKRARHEGGLRRRPGDVRQPGRLPRHARQHGHGGKIAMLGIPSEEIAIDWNTRRSSTCSRSRASTAARCTRPGTR